MKKKISEETWVIILLVFAGIYLFTLSLLSEGLYGDTDSITHYNLARYAFKYTSNFVDHWGKPLFTTLAAPFAQFGLQGVIFFNILCALVTAWMIYKIARKLNYRFALVAIPFSLFAPIFMINLFTSLTEILFALVLVAAIYFFLKERNILSGIIISFIPYARTEGIMYLFIFMVAFIIARKYRVIPFLFTGFIFYSIAGYFHYKTFFWFFTAMPYGEKGSLLYGSGKFWFYLERFPNLMGYPLLILSLIGLAYLVKTLFTDKNQYYSVEWITKYLLIICSFFAFVLIHSFLWWQGMMGVLASHRFMACIMPLGGLMAVIGLNALLSFQSHRIWIKKIIILLIVGLVIWMPFYYFKIPSILTKQTLVMKSTADALLKIGYKDKLLMYFDPKLAFFLGEDPSNHSIFSYPLPENKQPEQVLADGSLLVWDTHFAEVYKKLSLEDMLKNPFFKLIDGFAPDKDFKFSNGQNYMSFIFLKLTQKNNNKWITLDFYNFESDSANKTKILTDSLSFSGKKSTKLKPGFTYSVSIGVKLASISNTRKVILRGRVKVNSSSDDAPDKTILVLSVHNADGTITRYLSKHGSYYKPEPGNWYEMSIVTPLQTDIPIGGFVKLYVWYQGEKEIYLDDLCLEYIPVDE